MQLRALLLMFLLAVACLHALAEDSAPAPSPKNAVTEAVATTTVSNTTPATTTNAQPKDASEDSPPTPPGGKSTNDFPAMQLRSGFRLQLAAAAPLVVNPVALAFDSNGRLFVAEQSGGSSTGRVKLLEDTDGDGVFDTSSAFADDLPSPSALICYGGGVFVATSSQILFLSDTNGTGTASIRREVFGGFATSKTGNSPGGGVNNFTWGLDNRIHAATAGVDGNISCLAIPTSQSLALDGYDFAFNPRTLAMTVEADGSNRGVSFDNAGQRFTCTATRPVQFTVCDPIRATRNPLFIWPQLIADLSSGGPAAFPLVTTTNRQIVPTPAPFRKAGGLLVYRGGAFPTNYVNDVFVADPELHVVSRWHLRDNGLVPALERPKAEAGSEFLASADPTFRPLQVVSGPDGTLYIADLAREKLDETSDRGRIWRISPVGLKTEKPPQLATFKSPALVGLLTNQNAWMRDTAARLLFESGDTNAIPLLAKQLTRAREPGARLQSLHALDGLDALTEASLIAALRDPNEVVREHAVQLAEDFIRNGDVSNPLWIQLAAAANDRSLRVRFQAVFTLGLIGRPAVPALLASALVGTPENRAMQFAVLTAAGSRADLVFIELVGNRNINQSPAGWEFLRQLAMMTGAQAATGMDQVLTAIERARLNTADAFTVARDVGEGLHTAGRTFVSTAPQGTWRAFGYQALDIGVNTGTPELRAAAIRFLGVSGYSSQEVGDWLLALLVPGEPQAVQSAAIESLAHFQDPLIFAAFIQRWPGLSATSQAEIIARLLERFERTMALMTALEQNRIPATAITDVQMNFLRSHRDPTTAARAVQIFGPLGVSGLADRFAGVLRLTGSALRGRGLFNARCAGCHRLNGEGRAFGPDLDSAGTRGRGKLLQDILEPNSEVRPEYQTQVIQRTDNKLLFGLVSKSSSDVFVLRQPGAAPQYLPRTQVEETFSQNWSLMPQNTAAGLSATDLADLIEFITSGR